MSISERDIELQEKNQLNKKQDKQELELSILVEVDGSVTVEGRPGYVWHQPYGATQPSQVFNRATQARPNLPVVIGYREGSTVKEVLYVDPIVANDPNYSSPLLANHHSDHEPGGGDMLWLYTKVVVPLATYPGSTGLTVNVIDGSYTYDDGTEKTFAGEENVDLSASQPSSGQKRYVGLYLDASNALQTVNGTAVATSSATPEPTWPAGAWKLSVVEIDGDQTTISFADIEDRRKLFGTLSFSNQNANVVFAGPASGAAAAPAFRSLVPADLPGPLKVKNTSGATAAANDVGYINEAGEYKTTTTANANVSWCIVITGGANNADIYVSRRGRVTVRYTGTAPSAGHFLVTSTTAGAASRQTTMRPEIFAVCAAGGSGGTVEAILLTNRVFVPATSANFMLNQVAANAKTTSWTGTVNDAAPTTSPVTVATSTSNINTITPASANDEFKIVLRNTTRSNEALISSVSGNNVTFVSDTPLSTWQNGDSLTAQTDAHAQAYQTLDLSQSSSVPALATAILINNLIRDTGAASQQHLLHPYEAYAASKIANVETQVANVFFRGMLTVPIISRRVTHQNHASGSGTFDVYVVLLGYWLAAP